MSTDEKQMQIAAAVTDYHAAKLECAHIDQKLKTVLWTYREIGRAADNGMGDLMARRLVGGKIVLGYAPDDRFSTANLLNEAGFVELMTERENANNRLGKAKALMTSFGLTSIS